MRRRSGDGHNEPGEPRSSALSLSSRCTILVMLHCRAEVAVYMRWDSHTARYSNSNQQRRTFDRRHGPYTASCAINGTGATEVQSDSRTSGSTDSARIRGVCDTVRANALFSTAHVGHERAHGSTRQTTACRSIGALIIAALIAPALNRRISHTEANCRPRRMHSRRRRRRRGGHSLSQFPNQTHHLCA